MVPNSGLLLVHAHPDDETISHGITMAKYVAEERPVTLVTCTAGEEGEILVPDLAHLAASQQDGLAAVRKEELTRAMAQLGVVDHRFLGGFQRFRDSGMMGTEPNTRADSFWQADLLDTASELVRIIREVKPAVLVTYDDFGGYGHPDHIKAHRTAMYAFQLAAVDGFKPELGDPWQISKVYWTASPRGEFERAVQSLKDQGISNELTEMNIEDFQFFCDDDIVTSEISAPEFITQKLAALAEHRTQLDLNSGFFKAMRELGDLSFGTEYFRLVHGKTELSGDTHHREHDLFTGLVEPELP
jgi:N-acetyl-1-D-myo-inositol-2-amino-2-deoxy-alpha-D-glucopyranoside deacetylase